MKNHLLDNVDQIISMISPYLKSKPSHDFLIINGYLLNGTNTTLNKKYIARLLERFTYISDRYSKVLQMRFDLHFSDDFNPNPKLENKMISKFCKQMKHNYFKRSLGIEVEYVWAREVENSEKGHYHLAVWVSGHKKRSAGLPVIKKTIASDLNNLWASITDNKGVITETESFMVYRNEPATLKAAVYIASYICKTRGKDKNKQAGVRSFGYSTIPSDSKNAL